MDQISDLIRSKPPPPKRLAYGTAGFRDRYDLPLESVFFRMGMLAYLRSRHVSNSLSSLKCVGIVITASHNPKDDNGIKLVDYDGGMMDQSWEPFAESIVNSTSIYELDNSLKQIIESIYKSKRQGTGASSNAGIVIMGRDTRSHSKGFSNQVKKSVKSLKGKVFDLGEVTTPQVHYVVQKLNEIHRIRCFSDKQVGKCLHRYYTDMLSGYCRLYNSLPSSLSSSYLNQIILDASFGVGAISARTTINIMTTMKTLYFKLLNVDIRNDVGMGSVNDGCGAEYVQKNQLPPVGVIKEQDMNKLLCSFDGDADRIIFHSFLKYDENDIRWTLFDGDKIAVIISLFLCQEINEAGLSSEISMGVVQTAYANGSSTAFLRSHGIHVAIAKTGVKYVHHMALRYDVGVYFEANGHGTVILSSKFLRILKNRCKAKTKKMDDRKALALERLRAFTETINQAVGDALSDMFVTLAALKILNLTILSWHQIYTDLPSKQVKVPVKNKDLIVCSEDETMILSPSEIQDQLNILMRQATFGRCFIRPSGTEDVVRIYAEAATQEEASNLADKAIMIIKERLG